MADRRMTKPLATRSPKHPDPAARAEAPRAANAFTQLAAFEAAMKLFHARQLSEARVLFQQAATGAERDVAQRAQLHIDRKSTRLNSSHLGISYAVFCLKKKR